MEKELFAEMENSMNSIYFDKIIEEVLYENNTCKC